LNPTCGYQQFLKSKSITSLKEKKLLSVWEMKNMADKNAEHMQNVKVLVRAMKKKEVTLMVLADFSKAFDTVCFKTVINKMHRVGISKWFLVWLTNYLCDRRHFVQIVDHKYSTAPAEFGISQGSILGSMLQFNLYVADLQDNLPPSIKTFQYADDTTIYTCCPVSSISSQAAIMDPALTNLQS